MEHGSLAHLCLDSAEKYASHPALAMIRDGEICGRLTYKDMDIRSRQMALLLTQLGVERGSKVMLLSENSPEWVTTFFGISFAGAVSVPVLTGFSGDQIKNIETHAGVSAICLSRGMTEKIGQKEIPLIYIDSIEDEKITVSVNGVERQMAFQNISGDESFPQVKADELALIIYTSGTQGSSKGVMLSAANVISSAAASLEYAKITKRDRFLSVLPLAHSYECSIGLLAALVSGASVSYLDKPPSPSVLLPAMKMLRPTAMMSVPILIEKVYRNAIAPKLQKSPLFKFPLTRPLAIWVAGRKLMSALGGRLKVFGIGGAPLSSDVEKFLRQARFPYNIGYGLTEAAPLVSGSKPHRFPLRTSGAAAKGVTLRLVASQESGGEGEIQLQGPNVMMGYYNDEEKTAEAFTPDGWLRTGDLGRLDKKGRLQIRGRLKAMILGPSGENIFPEEIEGVLGSSRLVEDALVYSGEKGELVAMITLSDAAKAAADAIEKTLEELRTWTNTKLAVFSRLSRIIIKNEPFEKTPTMKIKRHLYE